MFRVALGGFAEVSQGNRLAGRVREKERRNHFERVSLVLLFGNQLSAIVSSQYYDIFRFLVNVLEWLVDHVVCAAHLHLRSG